MAFTLKDLTEAIAKYARYKAQSKSNSKVAEVIKRLAKLEKGLKNSNELADITDQVLVAIYPLFVPGKAETRAELFCLHYYDSKDPANPIKSGTRTNLVLKKLYETLKPRSAIPSTAATALLVEDSSLVDAMQEDQEALVTVSNNACCLFCCHGVKVVHSAKSHAQSTKQTAYGSTG